MRWLAAVLLMVNAAVFLWVSGGYGARYAPGSDIRVDVNRAGMALLHENENQTAQAEAARGNVLCYRIGPFTQSPDLEKSRDWLRARGIGFDILTGDVRELKAVRVFLGPYTQAQALAMAQRLQQSSLEHFMTDAEDGRRISLGYFTQEELAEKFVKQVKNRGFEAKMHPIYRILGPYRWIRIAATPGQRDLIRAQKWWDLVVPSDCA